VTTTSVKDGQIEAYVLAVEYQGTHVSILTKIVGDQEVTALMPDASFFAKPHNPGDQIGLIWDQKLQHQLTA
jgi:putative spermidine/putrescine transport system ATP-binding protein